MDLRGNRESVLFLEGLKKDILTYCLSNSAFLPRMEGKKRKTGRPSSSKVFPAFPTRFLKGRSEVNKVHSICARMKQHLGWAQPDIVSQQLAFGDPAFGPRCRDSEEHLGHRGGSERHGPRGAGDRGLCAPRGWQEQQPEPCTERNHTSSSCFPPVLKAMHRQWNIYYCWLVAKQWLSSSKKRLNSSKWLKSEGVRPHKASPPKLRAARLRATRLGCCAFCISAWLGKIDLLQGVRLF